MVFESELDFENAVIQKLVNAGWVNNSTGQPEILRYKTEKELIRNWADILFENNNSQDRLNDAPLTDGEMQQIMEQIKTLRTPVKLNGFINGKTVIIKRDNTADKLHFGHEVSLKIYDSQEIAGGQSRYQIAEQPVFSAKNALLNDRRGDFVLLINGMPVIHAELKKSGIPVSQACCQIEKYAHEGVFSGLFSLVQIFVAMTPEETLYFANPGPDGKFNTDYYFHWADFNNEPINDWDKIVTNFLSIPMAHQMIGFYTVADNTDETLKVMRSYQFYAADAISQAVAKRKRSEQNQRGGFIWHTTGSGKTMTSFKSAQLIANSGDADKVVFLMDRIELGTQSLMEYRGFAGDSDSVQATENTGVLVTKLKSSDPANTLIVTSIQKMSRVMEEGGYKAKDIEIINRKRLVFIIDECHRDTFGDMLINIKNTFPNAMFFGFTGTPIHDENKKKMNTTSDVFGNELHRYSIADGIRDKNVLGFDPTKVMTYADNELREAVALDKAKASTIDEVFSDPKKEKIYYTYMDSTKVPMAGYYGNDGKYVYGIEDYLPTSQYDRDEHRKTVIQDIRNNWIRLSRNGKFHAIFATKSIPEAIQYYRMFKTDAPELKVAALFDPNIDNNPGAIFKEDGLVEILTDYNTAYGVNFTLPSFAAYKKDVSLRLAHKSPYTGIVNDRSKQIDILIVVDQMLTGFDSKWVNTLYLDKVLRYEGLIQAFSRTNRLFDQSEKPFGIIRYYRKPHTMHRNIDDAFRLYSGERPYGIFVSKLGDNLKKMNVIYDDIVSLFRSAGLSDFEKLPDDRAARGKFAKLFKEFNTCLESAIIQGFTWDKSEYEVSNENGKTEKIKIALDETTFLTLALRYKELFISGDDSDGTTVGDVPYEIDPHLTEINTGAIDHNYMESRFRKYLKQLQDGVESTAALKELHKSFATLSQEQQKYARIFLTDVQQGNIIVADDKTLIDYINKYQADAHNDRVHRFAMAIGVNEQQLREFMNKNVTSENINEFGLFDKLKATVDKNVAKEYFERVDGQPVKMFRVPVKVDKILRQFILSGGFDIE
ncbi:MAG: HsdR family type I site-specific deoxyribonuclease [Clostridia bacterium]|nr:HsdR family type I site-specific deoxyribonuclease [Clostridia bacterium]